VRSLEKKHKQKKKTWASNNHKVIPGLKNVFTKRLGDRKDLTTGQATEMPEFNVLHCKLWTVSFSIIVLRLATGIFTRLLLYLEYLSCDYILSLICVMRCSCSFNHIHPVRQAVFAAYKPAVAVLLWEKNTVPWLISRADKSSRTGWLSSF
jgi:hypothetical protein